jgi:predicted ABC-class ATPase
MPGHIPISLNFVETQFAILGKYFNQRAAIGATQSHMHHVHHTSAVHPDQDACRASHGNLSFKVHCFVGDGCHINRKFGVYIINKVSSICDDASSAG